MAKIIVMIGAPGAGKGTQARLLSEKFGYPQISTGDILREIAQADTPQGREIRQTVSSGKLVSDELLADLVYSRTSRNDCEDGYILDGYPRTENQALELEKLAARQKKEILVVRVVVPEDDLLKRLTGRRTCSLCGEIYNIFFRKPRREGICDRDGAELIHRTDDNPETVKQRLSEYKAATAPLIDFYGQKMRLVQVRGDKPVKEVFEELLDAIDT